MDPVVMALGLSLGVNFALIVRLSQAYSLIKDLGKIRGMDDGSS